MTTISKQPSRDLKEDFDETAEVSFDLDRDINVILDEMAIGYAMALGSPRNMGLLSAPKKAFRP